MAEGQWASSLSPAGGRAELRQQGELALTGRQGQAGGHRARRCRPALCRAGVPGLILADTPHAAPCRAPGGAAQGGRPLPPLCSASASSSPIPAASCHRLLLPSAALCPPSSPACQWPEQEAADPRVPRRGELGVWPGLPRLRAQGDDSARTEGEAGELSQGRGWGVRCAPPFLPQPHQPGKQGPLRDPLRTASPSTEPPGPSRPAQTIRCPRPPLPVAAGPAQQEHGCLPCP